mgnify:CR=1 FL=1
MYNTTFRERPPRTNAPMQPRNGENKKRAWGIKVKWNNKTFRSFCDLARYTNVALDAPSIIYNEGCKLKGHKIEVIK